MKRRKQKDRKLEEGIYWTETGWRLFVRVRGNDWPASRKGELKPKRIADPDHELGIKELRTKREEWRGEALRAVNGGRVVAVAGDHSIRNDLVKYQQLPAFTGKDKKYRDRFLKHLETLIARVPAKNGVDGHSRPRLAFDPALQGIAIQKQEWELILGALFAEQKWKPGTYNLWLGSLKRFYNVLADPDKFQPNPAKHIPLMETAQPEAQNVDYRIIVAVLARLRPEARPNKNKIGFLLERQLFALARQGVSNLKLAELAGVSNTAIGKLFKRGPRDKPRPSEIIGHALTVQAFCGMRPIQWDKLSPDDYDPETRRLKVMASKKRDRTVVKVLDKYFGAPAMEAAIEANAVHPYDRHQALRMWYGEFKKMGIPKPWPYPYRLKHSYLTEALNATDGDVSGVQEQSGIKTKKAFDRYTEGGKLAARQRVADAFGEHMKVLLAPPKKKGAVLVSLPTPIAPKLTPKDYDTRGRGGPKRMLVVGR